MSAVAWEKSVGAILTGHSGRMPWVGGHHQNLLWPASPIVMTAGHIGHSGGVLSRGITSLMGRTARCLYNSGSPLASQRCQDWL
jgi:hypothetical protein